MPRRRSELAGVEPHLRLCVPWRMPNKRAVGRPSPGHAPTLRGQVPARLAELVGRRQALETSLRECSPRWAGKIETSASTSTT